jgi:hypothetical protein
MIRSRAVVAQVVDAWASRWLSRRLSGRQFFESVQLEPEVSGGAYTLERTGGRIVLRTADSDIVVATASSAEPTGGASASGSDSATLDEPVSFRIVDRQIAVEARFDQVEPGALLPGSDCVPESGLAAAVVNRMAAAYR